MNIKILISPKPFEKTTGIFKIRTHGGLFHSDEIVAIAMLILNLDNDNEKTVQIMRTREKLLSNIEIDVGEGKFDHHQKGGNGKRKNGIPYASCGLVWKEYGKKLIKRLNITNQKIDIDEIFEFIDFQSIQKIDAEDNGYSIQPHSYNFIQKFLPGWMDNPINYDKAFEKSLYLAIEILNAEIIDEINKNSSKYKVQELLNNNSSNILEIPNQIINWVENIVFENNKIAIPIDFVIFPYSEGGWAAQCVPKNMKEKFSQRIPFPKEWAGQTEELSKMTGINGAIFCHNGRFFVRAKSKEETIKLCELASSVY